MPTQAPTASRRCAPTAPTSSHHAAPARAGRCLRTQSVDHGARQENRRAAHPGADRSDGHAARRRRNPRRALPPTTPAFRSRCRPCRWPRSSTSPRRPAKPFWFQLYVIRDRGFSRALMDRAIAAKCDTLVLTVDLQVLGQRHKDIKNGLTVPPEFRIKNVHRHRHQAGLAVGHPDGQEQDLRQHHRPREGHGERQFAGEVDARPVRPGAETGKTSSGSGNIGRATSSSRAFSTSMTPGAPSSSAPTPSWCRTMAAASSDGTSSSIAMLPRVADAVGSATEILFDGGIRSGADIMRGAGARRAPPA